MKKMEQAVDELGLPQKSFDWFYSNVNVNAAVSRHIVFLLQHEKVISEASSPLK